jgi:hypothetical protein
MLKYVMFWRLIICRNPLYTFSLEMHVCLRCVGTNCLCFLLSSLIHEHLMKEKHKEI